MENLIEYVRLLLCADFSILLHWIGLGIAVFLGAVLIFIVWQRCWNKVWWKKNLPTTVGWGVMLALLYAATGIVKNVAVELRKDEDANLLRKALKVRIERGITAYRVMDSLNQVKKDQDVFVELCKKVYEERIRGGFSLKANIDKVSISSELLRQVEKHLENLRNNIRYDNYFRKEFEKHRHRITEGVINVVAKSQREMNETVITEASMLKPWFLSFIFLGACMAIFAVYAVKDIKEFKP